MGNLESKIAEGEGKHTPAANNNKEINEIKIDRNLDLMTFDTNNRWIQ